MQVEADASLNKVTRPEHVLAEADFMNCCWPWERPRELAPKSVVVHSRTRISRGRFWLPLAPSRRVWLAHTP